MKYILVLFLTFIFSISSKAEIGDIVVSAYVFAESSVTFDNTVTYVGEGVPSRHLHVNILSQQEFGPFTLSRISFVVKSEKEVTSVVVRDSQHRNTQADGRLKFFRLERVRTIGYGDRILFRQHNFVDPAIEAKEIYLDYLFNEIENMKEVRRKKILLSNLEKLTLEVQQMAACQALFL